MWEKDNLLNLELIAYYILLLQSNCFQQERFNGLPSSGDHVKQLTGAGIVTAGLKTLLRGAHTWQEIEGSTAECGLLRVGRHFIPFTHS